MRFKVPANDYDRLALAIGPDRIPEMSMPWIYQIDLSLTHNNGQVLELGTVSMLSNGGQDGLHDPDTGRRLKPKELELKYSGGLQCTRQNYELVRQAVDGPGVKSSSLLEYNEDFKAFFAQSSA